MRVCFVSDTHCLHQGLTRLWKRSGDWDALSECDLLVHCGDLTRAGIPSEGESTLRWLSELPVPEVVCVPGNHDFCLDPAWEPRTLEGLRRWGNYPSECADLDRLRGLTRVRVLVDEAVEVGGLVVWGSPVTPWFHDWAWNRTSEELETHWDAIPDGVDVLVTHGPPRGVLDRLDAPNPDGQVEVGCPSLLRAVRRVRPRVHAFGHIHEARGMREVDGVTFVNCSSVDLRYRPVHPPVFLDID